jgi:ABC-type Fe3+/spermidine/putrescine transport system ATPase subunit
MIRIKDLSKDWKEFRLKNINLEVKKANISLTDLPPELRQIGFIYQDYSLFPHLNVEQNIQFGLKLKKTQDTKFMLHMTRQRR